MSDLISRKAFLKFLEDRHIKYSIEWMVQNYSASTLYTMIENAPSVDAVEVVRCKDCKHMQNMGYRYCQVWQTVNGMGDDGFCNYGERADDE